MPATEIKRGQDACKAYVDKVCACAATEPERAKQCELAKALPEAIAIGARGRGEPGLEAATSSSSRTTACARRSKQCIEQTAKLPALGCQ